MQCWTEPAVFRVRTTIDPNWSTFCSGIHFVFRTHDANGMEIAWFVSEICDAHWCVEFNACLPGIVAVLASLQSWNPSMNCPAVPQKGIFTIHFSMDTPSFPRVLVASSKNHQAPQMRTGKRWESFWNQGWNPLCSIQIVWAPVISWLCRSWHTYPFNEYIYIYILYILYVYIYIIYILYTHMRMILHIINTYINVFTYVWWLNVCSHLKKILVERWTQRVRRRARRSVCVLGWDVPPAEDVDAMQMPCQFGDVMRIIMYMLYILYIYIYIFIYLFKYNLLHLEVSVELYLWTWISQGPSDELVHRWKVDSVPSTILL